MKKIMGTAAAVGLGVVALAFLSRERKFVVSDFQWSLDAKTVPYSFQVTNRTSEPLTVVVEIEAQRARESRDGTKIIPLGEASAEVSLAARGQKKVEGAIDLISFGDSSTAVSYHARALR